MILKTKHKMFIASIMQKSIVGFFDLLGHDYRNVVCARHGVKYRLDLQEGIDFALFVHFFEKSTLKKLTRLVQPGMTVLDVGANIGAHALQLARLVGPEGRVVAFEPTSYAYAKLLENLELNPEFRDRLVAEQIMLTHSDDTPPADSLYSSWPLISMKDKHPYHGGQKKALDGAETTCLDSYISKHRIQRVDVMKMDVDGFECDILKGASKMIKEYHPLIVMELCPYALEENGASIEELLEILYSEKYYLELIGRGELPKKPDEISENIVKGASVNIVAMPESCNLGEAY